MSTQMKLYEVREWRESVGSVEEWGILVLLSSSLIFAFAGRKCLLLKQRREQ